MIEHQHGHSEFQMDHFITIRSGGTPYGCYRQAMREVSKRARGLAQMRLDCERLRVDIAELEARQGRWFRGRFARMRDAIDLRQKRSQLAEAERAIADTERELQRFREHAEAFRAMVGELSPARRATLDAEFWEHRIRCMAALDFMTTGRLQRGTIELLVSIPREMRRRIAAEALAPDRHETLIEWFQSQEVLESSPIPCLCEANS